MTAIITAEDQGQAFPVDLTRVTGLDALVYRQTCGDDLDARVGAWLVAAPDDSAGWSLADRALIKWLYVRQNVDPNAPLAAVADTVTLLPAVTGGDLDVPGAV